ncbi:uncharacterized protein [Apostichopus japonicus]|uniref:uncharacterized protein n=1 Tax=Stichopus japonicus TaxID=307972 RepID=UPI003AB2474E
MFYVAICSNSLKITSHKCAVHCAGKIGPLTRFTPISWSKVIACTEDWCKLSGPQYDVAHEVLSTCKEQPDSFEDIFYHRDCYAAFTNETDIIRAKKRQTKLPQHKAVEDQDTSIEEDHQTEIDEPLEKQLLRSSKLASSSSDTRSRSQNVLPEECIICKIQQYKVNPVSLKRGKERLIRCETLTAGKLLEADAS